MSQLTEYPPSLVCAPCWAVRENDRYRDRHPTEHPQTVFIPLAEQVYAHRMMAVDADGILTVCGQRWTNAGLTLTFTGTNPASMMGSV